MRRLVAVIAVLFAFAAVMGGTVAHAHRYIATPIVVLNLVDEDNQSIPVVVQVQRGQIDLGAGIVMPCGPHHAIGTSATTLAEPTPTAAPKPEAASCIIAWPVSQLLRPPISV